MSTPAWTPVTHTAWTITDPFWAPRRTVLATTTLLSQHQQLRERGQMSRIGIMPSDPARAGSHIFYDSDVAKWLEAVAYALAERPDARLRTFGDEVIAGFARIQLPDGYLNSHFGPTPELRWSNLEEEHELYCLGHLIEAAVAWREHLGCDRLLTCCLRAVDHVWLRFGPDGQPAYCGHPEIELALMRLWRLTGDERHRQLCRLFIDRRGRAPGWFAHERAEAERTHVRRTTHRPDEFQDACPLTDEQHADGHAVRALYLACGALDLAHAEGDSGLTAAMERIWGNIIGRRMHVTGGIGSAAYCERFTSDFDLDPWRAYNETCASIALAMLAQRLLRAGPRGDAGDILELALHNGMLAGWSLDGEHYAYANPLSVDPGWNGKNKQWHGTPWGRQRWFGCSCCPPNIARTVAALGSYAASTNGPHLALHLHLAGRLRVAGWDVELSGDWVRSGRVDIVVHAAPVEGHLHLRLPGWSAVTTLHRNGAAVPEVPPAGYAVLHGLTAGTRLDLSADVSPRRIHPDPRAGVLAGCTTLAAGPLIYCLESTDHATPLDALRLADEAELSFAAPDAALAGCRPISAAATAYAAEQPLYSLRPPRQVAATVSAVPFCLWGHRGPGALRTWIRRA
jgi:hypothetical protein